MDAYYFDSSALAKQYANESGTTWVSGIVDGLAGNIIYTASITEVEVASSISRKLREGLLSLSEANAAIIKLQDDCIDVYDVTDADERVIARAVALVQTHTVRAYDAVQLATALLVNENRVSLKLPALIFVSADINLNNAAQAEGLTVDDPNAHP